MDQQEMMFNVEFSFSKERQPVSLTALERSVTEFLELYGEEPIVGKEFRSIIGEGDGESRFSRLLGAAHHQEDAQGFFAEVLKQLEQANGETAANVAVNGIKLPYHFLLAILEQVVPGEQFFTIKSLRRLEKLTNIKVPQSEREMMQQVLDQYPVRLSSHTIRQIRLSPAVAYQFMPFSDELDQEGAPPIIPSGSDSLHRVHKTRMEFDCDGSDEEMTRNLDLIAAEENITDVVLYSRKDVVRSLYRVGKIIERLAAVPHITAVRLRSWNFNYEPQSFSDAVIKRITSLNKLDPAAPTRLEIETRFLHSSELKPEHEKLVKALKQRGVTVYNNTPLLAFINDSEEEMMNLTSRLRRIGIELTNLYVAGMPLQEKWSEEHPIHVSQIVDIASHLRRTGSGRELPRYVVRTTLGDVDLWLNALPIGSSEDGSVLLNLLLYHQDYFTALDPDFTWPEGVETDDEGHPIVTVPGLIM
jgi:L-lysine 2,3-aminomutase